MTTDKGKQAAAPQEASQGLLGASEPGDGLEVRRWGDGWGVWDTLTEAFVGDKRRSRYWLQHELDERRKHWRPIIVRFVYGLSTAQSRALGLER